MKRLLSLSLTMLMIVSGTAFASATDDSMAIAENQQSGNPEIETRAGGAVYSVFTKSGQSTVNMAKKRVSPYVKGPASISYGNSVTHSATYSTSLSSGDKGLIKAKATVTCSYSLTNSTKFSVTFKVSSGKTQAVYFTPKGIKVSGTLKTYNSTQPNVALSSKSVSGTFPKNVGSFADGTYSLAN